MGFLDRGIEIKTAEQIDLMRVAAAPMSCNRPAVNAASASCGLETIFLASTAVSIE